MSNQFDKLLDSVKGFDMETDLKNDVKSTDMEPETANSEKVSEAPTTKRRSSKSEKEIDKNTEALINIGIPASLHKRLKTLSVLKAVPVRNLICDMINYSFDKKYDKEMKDLMTKSLE